MNIIQAIKQIKNSGQNPKDMVMQMAKSSNNPMLNNLVNMANKGDNKGVQDFARNMFKEKGIDIDKDLVELKELFK